MQALESLIVSLIFLLVAIIGITRILGVRELEQGAIRLLAFVLVFALMVPVLVPITARAVTRVQGAMPTCSMPAVVLVHPEELALGGLVVLGHAVAFVWILRRRVRRDAERAAREARIADQRRSRGRLPPQSTDGGAL